MTTPRQVLPGTTYLVTRRCSQRQFLLRPSKRTNAIFEYVLAVAARRFGVRIHAYCALSNHFHVVLTDTHARLPAFEQFLHSLVARAVNASLGRWESFWAPSSYSAVAIQTPSDVIAKIAYVLANPVAAGLVRSGRQWPGPWSPPEAIGGAPIQMERPGEFFRPNGPLPRHTSLQLTRPPGFDSVAEFARQLDEALASCEARAAETITSGGRQFMGVARVLSQKPTARPAQREPRRALHPRVACRDKWKRIEALCRLGQFAEQYGSALSRWREGLRDVLFPPGTYLLRIAHGVRTAPA